MEKTAVLKPNKLAFILTRSLTVLVALFVLLSGVSALIRFIVPESNAFIIPFIVFIPLFGIVYWYFAIEYSKREYHIFETKIIQKSGTIFSSHENELVVKNITHLKLHLPFIQNKLFGTGIISIESAGSHSSEVTIVEIDNPEILYKQVQTILKNNGFIIDTNELMMEERPDPLGVFFEIFKNFLLGLGIALYVGVSYFEDSDTNLLEYTKENFGFVATIVLVILAGLIIWQTFVFLDLQKRVYKIYRNVITYKEGFLNKNYTIIPYQNLSDSEVRQSFVDRIFHLYDVKVSSKGSGHEILFKNIKNGQKMSNTLDELINDISLIVKSGEDPQTESGIAQKKISNQSIKITETFSSDYRESFRPDSKYHYTTSFLLAGIIFSLITTFSILFLLLANDSQISFFVFLIYLLIPFVILSILAFVHATIQVSTKKFEIKESAAEYQHKFINKSNIEFSFDKVTGVILNQSFIQKWFGVMTLSFWSIGSGHVLRFSDVKFNDKTLTKILNKFKFQSEDPIYSLKSNYSVLEWIKSTIFSTLIFGIFLIGVMVVMSFLFGGTGFAISIGIFVVIGIIVAVTVWYKHVYYSFSQLHLRKSHIYFQKGFLYKKYYYVPYQHLKDITTTRYPFSEEGKIRFNIAGEQIITHANSRSVLSHNLTIEFTKNIRKQDEIIDYILDKKPTKNMIEQYAVEGCPTNTLHMSYPSIKNPMLPTLLSLALPSLLLLVLIGLIPSILEKFILFILLLLINTLVIGFVIISTKVKSYSIQDYRVIGKSGIFYKKQTSIIFDRINFINKNQKLINKIFKNGNVIINTVGSRTAELQIRNISDYEKVYNDLQQRYEQESKTITSS